MANIHRRNFTVRWSELDANGRFGLEHYLRYLIETAYDWGESLDLGYQAYERLGIYWLIRETELLVETFPRHNEEISLTIWMNHWQRVRGVRSFRITNQAGALYAQGSQKIVVMDVHSQRPTKLEDDVIRRFKLDDPDQVIIKDRLRISPSSQILFQKERIVNWTDLDAQNHVNNVVYVNYARDLVNEYLFTQSENAIGTPSRYVHIEYLSPAIWQESLILNLFENGQDNDLKYYRIQANRPDGSPIMVCVLGVGT